MNGSHWTLKVSGIVLALFIAVLATNSAAAEKNDPNRAPTFRERIDAAREGCKNSKGTFTMSIEVSQGRAHTNCAETDGSNTSCTISMSSSVCENKPAEHSTGSWGGRPIGDITVIEAEITQADGQLAAPGNVLPAFAQEPASVETTAPGDAPLPFIVVEPATAEPSAEAAPIEFVAIEDDND